MADNALPAWDETEDLAPALPAWDETESIGVSAPPVRPASRGFQAPTDLGEQADMDFRVGEYVRAAKAQEAGSPDFAAGSGNVAFKEGVKRGLAGMEQFGIRALEAAGVLPAGSTQDFTVKENARREDYDYASRFGNKTAQTVNKVAGELTTMAPTVFIPGGGALKASEAVRTGAGVWNASKALGYRTARVGVDAAAGSVPGLLQYAESDDERILNVAIGATLSGGVRAGVEVLQMLRPTNIAQNLLGVESALASKATAEGATLEKVGPLNLSQLTGSPDVLAGELLARRGKGVQDIISAREGAQYGSALKYFKKESDAAFGAAVPGEQVGERVKAGFQKAVDSITTTRRNNWAYDMALAKQAGGGRKFIASDALKDELYLLARELGDPLSDAGSKAVARELYRDLVQISYGQQATPAKITAAGRAGYPKVTSGPGQLSVEQADILLKKYTDWSTKSGRPLKDAETGADRFVGARLKDALLKDLDATAAATPNDKAVIALKRARENYRIASDDLKALGQEVVERLLEKKQIPAVEHFADVFKRPGITPSQVRGTIDVLNKHDPVAVKQIQRKWVDDALDAAATADPERLPGSAVRETGFDPAKFWTAMDFDSAVAREVFKGADRARFQTGMLYLERIFPRGHGKVVVPEGGARDIGQAAMNLSSWNMVFVMGQLARTAAPHAFAKAMFTEQGVNALKIIAEPKRYPPTVLANAALYIKSLEGDAHESRNQETPQ